MSLNKIETQLPSPSILHVLIYIIFFSTDNNRKPNYCGLNKNRVLFFIHTSSGILDSLFQCLNIIRATLFAILLVFSS